MIYREYSKFLVERFGEKVYKLPIKLNLTCPNRDGTCGVGGCIFCGEEGGSFENVSGSVSEQLEINKARIQKRFKAYKYIAYFQNFTNTYLDFETFKNNINQCLLDNIVGISISTRPDCLPDKYIDFLEEVNKNRMVTLELGLQTVNYHTLKKINRGHGLADFIDATIRARQKGLRICAHIILNLPWDNEDDVIETAHILNALGVEEVKLHALYIVEGTKLAEMYKNEEINIISLDDYKNRVKLFLTHLNKDTVIQRVIGRAPEKNSLFCNWNTSWWKIRDEILDEMENEGLYQGQCYERIDYND